MRRTTQDFAAAVAQLESRLRRLPDEAEISDDLRWTDSGAALIALGQEAEAAGLVKIIYEDNRRRRYASADA
jgi:hypothetical protein